MSFRKKENKTREKLLPEVEKLRAQLAEAEETLHAIRSGKVDALVVSTPQGDQVFTLKGAERPYRILIERMKEGAVTLAGDNTIFYCNQAFADMLRTPLEKMIGTAISQFVSPADKLMFEELLRQGRAGSSKGEITFLAGDGTAVPIHLSVNTMLLDGLSTVYLVATDVTERKQAEEALQKAHDELEIKVQERTAELVKANEELHIEIIERKQAEEALRESEQRWATTLASIGDAAISTDAEGRITFMNAVAEALTGWILAEALTKPVKEVFNIINEYTRTEVEDPVTKVLQEGTIVGLANHTILVRKDGTEVPIDDSGAPIRDRDGKTMGVVLVFRDITERKRAEEALRESEQRFMKLFQGNTAAIALTRLRDRCIIEVNEKWQDVLGFSREEVIGRPANKIKTWKHPEEQMRAIHDLEMHGAFRNRECEFLRKNGEVWTGLMSSEVIQLQGEGFILTSLVDITERKRVEEELARSSRRVSEILESITDGFMAIDNSWRFTYANQRAAGNLGLKPEDIIGQNIWEKFPGIKGTDHEKYYRKVMQQHEPQHFEMRGVLTDKWYDIRVYPSAEGISVFWQDITERKRAEEALRMSNQQLDLLSYTASKLLTSDNPQQIVEELCKRVLRSLDCHAFFNYLVDEDKQRLHLNACAGIPEETAREIEWLDFGVAVCGCATRDGARIVCENIPEMFDPRTELVRSFGIKAYACHPLFSRGRVIGTLSFGTKSRTSFTEGELTLMKTVSDHVAIAMERARAHKELEILVKERTTELEEANKALLESESSYRKLTESIDDLFFAMDKDLRYTYWNKASEALTGILAKDAIGKSLYELFPDIKGTKAEQLYIEALKTQQPQRFENQFQIGDKKLIFEINAYPSKDGISIIAKDITEKKMFEAHLLRAQRMESIGILAGGIAHNLNNMLTPMMMSLQMLKEKFKDEQSQKMLSILEKNSERSADLIKQVLSFSRGVEGERAPLAVKHLITEIKKIAKETFPKNIEIGTDIQGDLFTVSGDATQLHQVLMNLCVNARDAMPDGGILSIKASNFLVDESYARMHAEAKVGSYVLITVSDTGIGIPPKIIDRIFEPFFTTKMFGKGTGLGLSTSIAIVKSHGGFMDVHSEPGKGTDFSIYLPAITTAPKNVEETQPELLAGNGELVLVAEDEDSVREITISTLEKNGYSVLAADDGAQAVAEYARNTDKTKVILMDIMMPIMDGYASIRAIRKISPEVKIIAVSGLAEKDKLKNVAEYTNAFLPKPYTAEKLLKTIHEVLSMK